MNKNDAEKWMPLAAQFALMSSLMVIIGGTRTALREAPGTLVFIMACGILTLVVPMTLFHLFKTIIPLFRKRTPERFHTAIAFGGGTAFMIPAAYGFALDGFLWIFFWIAALRLIGPMSIKLQAELIETTHH